MDRIFFDLSAYNIYKAATLAIGRVSLASMRTVVAAQASPVPENTHEWSRVPVAASTKEFYTGLVATALDAGRNPDVLVAQPLTVIPPKISTLTWATRTLKTAAVTSGLVYVEPDFKAIWQDDPRHPQAAYIKAAHGTAGPGAVDQYPIEDYVRPALAALGAGWGVMPYHYYYMDMVARDQMAAFVNSIAAAASGDLRLYGTGDPVIDLEDNASAMYKSFAWDGNSDPSRQIANVKFFLGTVFKLALDTCDQLFGAKLGRPVLTRIYSGAWFWNPMMQLLMLQRPGGGYWPEHQAIFDYYNKRLCIDATYTGDHQPAPIPNTLKMLMINNVARQYASTAVPPIVHWPTPGMDGVLGSSLDQNLWLGDEVSYQKFIGVPLLPIGVTPPPPPPTTGRTLDQVDAALAVVEAKLAKVKGDL